MPVTTAAVTTSRRARRARRNECSSYHLPSSQGTQPRSHSELVNPAACHNTKGSSGGKAQGSSPDSAKKKLRVVTVEGIVASIMEEGEAQTLAMTTANPPGSGSRTMSASSSNESSPTTTRAPAPGSDESPQGVERSFKRRRSFSKLTTSSVWISTTVLELSRVRVVLRDFL